MKNHRPIVYMVCLDKTCATRAHTPNPVYAIPIPTIPLIMADSNDVLVLVLKSNFFVRTVIWVIDKALIIRTEPITLMRGVNSFRSKNVESEKSIFALVIDYYYLCNKNCLIREYRCKHREGSVSKSLPLILFSSDYQIYILDSHFCGSKVRNPGVNGNNLAFIFNRDRMRRIPGGIFWPVVVSF